MVIAALKLYKSTGNRRQHDNHHIWSGVCNLPLCFGLAGQKGRDALPPPSLAEGWAELRFIPEFSPPRLNLGT